MMSPPHTILIADDHDVIRDGIRFYFEDEDEFLVKDEAANGKEVLKLLENNSYDIILTDINMPEMDGIALMRHLREMYPEQKVLVLSMHGEAPFINKMIALGANGYILKKSSRTDLIHAIKTILSGTDFFSDEVYQAIVQNIAGKKTIKQRTTLEVDLTKREKEVLKLVMKEMSNQEIADALYISVRTVEGHKHSLLAKTGCKNLVGLVMYAVERQLFPEE